jgi:hypothetical protein
MTYHPLKAYLDLKNILYRVLLKIPELGAPSGLHHREARFAMEEVEVAVQGRAFRKDREI